MGMEVFWLSDSDTYFCSDTSELLMLLIVWNQEYITFQISIFFQLTGAGWGGCIVALVPEENVKEYIDGLKTKYYANQTNFSAISQDLEKLIFQTEPGSGAQIFTL